LGGTESVLSSILRNTTILIVCTVVAIVAFDNTTLFGPKDPGSKARPKAVQQKTLTQVSSERTEPARNRRERSDNDYGGQTLVLDAGPGGHYFVDAMVNYEEIRFLVDTGASMIALNRADAERLGIDLASLDYRYQAKTANGVARVAHVVLDEIMVGDITFEKIPAAVVDGEMDVSLLGMSFLKRLSSFEIRDDQLVMRW